VHLVAALAEALGVLFLFRNLEGKRTLRRTLVGISLGFASLCLAGAWHMGANVLVSERLDPMVFAAGVVSANLLFLLLLSQFLKQAYLGGFLHGAD
jgi:drug/metabolite transporter (DMT)-like permease